MKQQAWQYRLWPGLKQKTDEDIKEHKMQDPK